MFLDCDLSDDILILNVYVKNGFVRTYSRQSVKCKMTAQTNSEHNCFEKLNFIIGCVTKTSISKPHPFSFSLSN